MHGFLKRKWKEIIITCVCVIAVVVTIVLYSISTSNHIFDESAAHLDEVATQINDKFGVVAKSNVDTLNAIKHHINYSIDHLGDDKQNIVELDKFIVSEKDARRLTDIVFLSDAEENPSITDSGETYIITCKSGLPNKEDPSKSHPIKNLIFERSVKGLLDENKNGILCTDEDGKMYLLFVSDYTISDSEDECHHNYNFGGFKYYAMGFLYDVEQMQSLLEVYAFNGKGISYITRSSGRVILQMGSPRFVDDQYAEMSNYLDFLSDKNVIELRNKSFEDFQKDFAESAAKDKTDHNIHNTLLIYDKEVGVEYYLTYQPVGFDNWMFIGLVPSDIINASTNSFRTQTILFITAIFAVVGAVVVWLTVMASKRKVKAKELEKQSEVKSRNDLFDLLTFNSNDLFVLFSAKDFSSKYVSANIAQVLGLNIEDVRKDVRTLTSTFEHEHGTFTEEGLQKLPLGRTWEIDIQLRHIETHHPYWFHLTLYHTLYNDEASFILMLSDRTKEHAMSENLEEALVIAKSANEAKSNFLANMSHDIRTPMNAIIGYATLVAKDADNGDKVRDYIKKITFSSQHLLSLINDILDMSKIESGKTNLNAEEFDLPELLDELYAIMAPQAKSKGHDFKITTKGNLPNKVIADKLRLNQVLINLLSNSVKYTPENGHIELIAEALEENVLNHAHVRIIVKDDGIGMSEKYVKEIFEPFSREETAKNKGIQGTGLGMAITKSIVDLMGGVIKVESELDKGSTFTLELELLIANEQQDETEFWSKRNVNRVLVVDNDEDICINVQSLMEGTGVKVDYATSGEQAVQMVKEAYNCGANYDVILLDWKMPEMNGLKTAEGIRAIIGNNVPMMVLTSYNFDEISDEAKEVGIDICLSKPFAVSHFREAIEKTSIGSRVKAKVTPESVTLSGLKVLAAEDNEINAEILLELLDIENMQCEIAVNGKEALNKFESSAVGQYDMIFMDVQMPVMNGYEATKAIRECNHPSAKTIPIIAMTANAFEDDVKQALDAGMDAHIAKPIDMNKLKVIIGNLRKKS